MWRNYSRITYIRLPKQRSFNDSSLYLRFVFLFALPKFCDVPRYLSHRFAKHFYYVVLRNILRGMFEENEMVFAARNDGPVG